MTMRWELATSISLIGDLIRQTSRRVGVFLSVCQNKKVMDCKVNRAKKTLRFTILQKIMLNFGVAFVSKLQRRF